MSNDPYLHALGAMIEAQGSRLDANTEALRALTGKVGAVEQRLLDLPCAGEAIRMGLAEKRIRDLELGEAKRHGITLTIAGVIGFITGLMSDFAKGFLGGIFNKP